jgi:hypothetical protein
MWCYFVGRLVSDGILFGPDVTLVSVPGHTPLAPGAISTMRDACVGSIELKPDDESARRP